MNESRGVREFVMVVEKGGFTAAADAMDVSASFVSRQVQRLEKRVGARLLNRTTRSVTLTDLGRTYYNRSRDILDQLAKLEADMAEMQQQPKGLVRITAAGLFAERYVAPAIAEFTQLYPEVQVELDTRMRIVDIVEEGYDLAVRLNAPSDSSLIARKVANRRMIVAGSPDYFAKHGRPSTPDELRGHNCLLLSGMGWRFRWGDTVRSVHVRGTWSCDSAKALVAAATKGAGLVRFTSYYLDEPIERGDLEAVLEDYEVDDTATWLVYANRQHLPTRVRYLVDFLAKRLKETSVPSPD